MKRIGSLTPATVYPALFALMSATALSAGGGNVIVVRHAPVGPESSFSPLELMVLGIILLIFVFMACATFPTYRRLEMFLPPLLPRIKPRDGGKGRP